MDKSGSMRGNKALAVILGSGQKAVQLAAGRVERVLLNLGCAAVDQRPFAVGDDIAKQFFDGTLSELRHLDDVADDLAAEKPQVVAVPVAGWTGEPLTEQMNQKWLEERDQLFAGDDVAILARPAICPSRQVGAECGKVGLGYDGVQLYILFGFHASDFHS